MVKTKIAIRKYDILGFVTPNVKTPKIALKNAKIKWPKIKGIKVEKVQREYMRGRTADYFIAKAPSKNVPIVWDPW